MVARAMALRASGRSMVSTVTSPSRSSRTPAAAAIAEYIRAVCGGPCAVRRRRRMTAAAREYTISRWPPRGSSRPRPVSPVERSYGPDDLDADDPERIGAPGEFPFTRGNHPGGYRDKLWTFRQYSGFGTAEWSNERYKLLLKEGGTGLSVAADLPTQIGYDSDDPDVEEEVGRVGVALDSLADAEILFRDIPLDRSRRRGRSTGPPRSCSPSTWPSATSRACRVRSCGARCRTTSSRSTSRAARGSGRPRRRSA